MPLLRYHNSLFFISLLLPPFKNNVKNVSSASPKLCIFFVLKVSYVQLYTLFLSYEYIMLSLKHILSITLITKPS